MFYTLLVGYLIQVHLYPLLLISSYILYGLIFAETDVKPHYNAINTTQYNTILAFTSMQIDFFQALPIYNEHISDA